MEAILITSIKGRSQPTLASLSRGLPFENTDAFKDSCDFDYSQAISVLSELRNSASEGGKEKCERDLKIMYPAITKAGKGSASIEYRFTQLAKLTTANYLKLIFSKSSCLAVTLIQLSKR